MKVLANVCVATGCFGILGGGVLKVLHLPFANELLFLGVAVSLVGLFVLLALKLNRRKEDEV